MEGRKKMKTDETGNLAEDGKTQPVNNRIP